MGTCFHKKLLCGLWYTLLLTGLNSVLRFIDSGKLILILVLFLVVDLFLDKYAFIFNILLSLLILHSSNYIGSIFDYRWFAWLAEDINRDISAIANQGFTIILPVTSMALSLVAVVFLYAVATRLFFRGKGITLFLCIGAAALSTVHLWIDAGSAWYTVLFVIIGLIIKATLPMKPRESPFLGRWVRILTVWVLVLVSVAYAMPAPSLDLSDWLSSSPVSRNDPLGIPRKVGYSAFDNVLGGPLIEDDTLALRVNSPVPLYLKGETRTSYNGTGWNPESTYFKVDVPEFQPGHLKGQEIGISIQDFQGGNLLFTPRYPLAIGYLEGTVTVSALPNYPVIGGASLPYEYYKFTSTIKVGDTYAITVFLPDDDPVYLRTLSNDDADARYYSLENVPERVQQLARSIVRDETNGYDKAEALATFLRFGRWDYSLNTAAPPVGADFVEDFLFEQRKGYCAHYSTAFVVMARSVGLPARWVKGYSIGVKDRDGYYLVANKHAHSWAEVWFDDYGWIPFEPTPGGLYLRPDVPGTVTPNGGQDPGRVEPEDPMEGLQPGEEKTGSAGWLRKILEDRRFYAFGGGLLALLLILFLLLRGLKGTNIGLLYARLQSRLKLFGWQRRNWETPREHLNRVDRLPDKPQLTSFVHDFEGSVYGGEEVTEGQRLGRRYSILGLLLRRMIRIKGN